MSREIVIKCPEHSLPLVSQEGGTMKCPLCEFKVEVENLETKDVLVSPDDMKTVLERAKAILESPLERKLKLEMSIGGQWARVFFALQAINDGLGLTSGAKLVENVVKSGLNMTFGHFTNAAQWRAASSEVIRHGEIRKETADALFRELLYNFNKPVDPDWDVGKINGENAEQ